jgi:hypothetical protein
MGVKSLASWRWASVAGVLASASMREGVQLRWPCGRALVRSTALGVGWVRACGVLLLAGGACDGVACIYRQW